jgi:hypothetical protein
MGEALGKDLQVAILLRGLPSPYSYLVAMVKLRETMPPVEDVLTIILMNSSNEKEDVPVISSQARVAHCEHNGHDASKCWILHLDLVPACHVCGEKGHIKKRCPSLNNGLIGKMAAQHAMQLKNEG